MENFGWLGTVPKWTMGTHELHILQYIHFRRGHEDMGIEPAKAGTKGQSNPILIDQLHAETWSLSCQIVLLPQGS